MQRGGCKVSKKSVRASYLQIFKSLGNVYLIKLLLEDLGHSVQIQTRNESENEPNPKFL